ncbi:major facilitator superfamily transporter [Phlyctema vagabunda]|uniref:Major facilitator superfamily transporter n=1 Tax=Phlyctema vagabunda TaxID=108571 RepID=A0ABR4P896_9HELO
MDPDDGIELRDWQPEWDRGMSTEPTWATIEETPTATQATLHSIILLFPQTPTLRESVENLRQQGEAEDVEAGRSSSPDSTDVPPQDGGLLAWWFLACCFMVEVLVWGFLFSFGIFQDYYSTTEPFKSDYSKIATIGTTASGITYMAGALLFVFNKWPRLARLSTIFGLPIMACAIVAASFATRVWHLVLTQGILYACGASVLYYASILYMDDWFDKRAGLAFGIMWAGTGVGGLIIPFIMKSLLKGFGIEIALRAYAVLLLIFALPLMVFLRPRIPQSQVTQPPQSTSFFLGSTFWIFQFANIVQSLGFFLPEIYLPSFARALGLSEWEGTLLIGLTNFFGVISAVMIGWMTDRYDVSTIIALSTVLGAVWVLLLWGLATNLTYLCFFSVLYGLCAGGFTSTYTGMAKEMKRMDDTISKGLLIGILSAGRGIGALVSGPVSEKLMEPHALEAITRGYGSGYTGLIVLSGTTGLVVAVTASAKRLGWI